MTIKINPAFAQKGVWSQVRHTIWWISRSKSAVIGIVIGGIALFIALAGPWISPHPFQEQDLSVRLLPLAWMDGGDWHYPFGTDGLGRCLLSRIIYGTRVAVMVGGVVTIFAASVGVFLGLISGYFGRSLDSIIMRIVDVQWSFPYLILAIAVMALLGTSLFNLILVLALSNWVTYARTVRGVVMSLKEEEFIIASVAAGAKHFHIILKHILPNTMAPILVLASFNLAGIILMESALSFLGLGIQPPIPSWGAMISDGREYMYTAWWLVALPGFALMLLVLGVNQLGDGLRDLLDPRLRGVL